MDYENRPKATAPVDKWLTDHVAPGCDMPYPVELEGMGAPPEVIEFAKARVTFWEAYKAHRLTLPIDTGTDRFQITWRMFGGPLLHEAQTFTCHTGLTTHRVNALKEAQRVLETIGPEAFARWSYELYAALDRREKNEAEIVALLTANAWRAP